MTKAMTDEKLAKLGRKYSFFNNALKQAAKDIAKNLFNCTITPSYTNAVRNSHLHLWYVEATKRSKQNPWEHAAELNGDTTVKPHLANVCSHCMAAQHHVLERKKLKRQFGIVKGQITKLGES